MIIVGLQGCKECKEYYKLHPDYTYIEIRKDKNQRTSKEIMKIKLALGKLKFDMKFPVTLTDDLKILIPRDKLIQELKSTKVKSSGCKTCGGK